MNLDDLQRAWKQRQKDLADDRVDQLAKRVRSRTSWLERTVLLRDFREAIAAVIVVVVFGRIFFYTAHNAIASIGALVILVTCVEILGVLYWARRGRQSHDQPLNEFCTAQLSRIDRQIFILRNVTWWYTGPIIIGGCLIVISRAYTVLLPTIICGVFFAFGWFIHWLNQRAVNHALMPLREELVQICDELQNDPIESGEQE